MADFDPDKVFCPNFQIAISQVSKGVRSWNFESFHISMIPTNGAKIKKFWEVRVSCPGWFDMELPYNNQFLANFEMSQSLPFLMNMSLYTV